MTAPEDRVLELRFKPLWLYVDRLREFCTFFAEASFAHPEVGQRVGLTVHELVENAIKYSPRDERAMLELRVLWNERRVRIEVTNFADIEHARRLRTSLAALSELEPAEGYAMAMKRALTLPETESGLGLPRIRYEGGMELETAASTDGRLTVIATGDTLPTAAETGDEGRDGTQESEERAT